jgi:hypothetical protein
VHSSGESGEVTGKRRFVFVDRGRGEGKKKQLLLCVSTIFLLLQSSISYPSLPWVIVFCFFFLYLLLSFTMGWVCFYLCFFQFLFFFFSFLNFLCQPVWGSASACVSSLLRPECTSSVVHSGCYCNYLLRPVNSCEMVFTDWLVW